MKRRKDSGFALLLILLTSAVIGIMLYAELPRIAFESQRQKEQLLVERGEQYKRAIQVFFKENRRYPARIEDLESFNNRHYLRRRFKDPMTGKDEWRIVHIQNGVLTDSITTKKNPQTEMGSTYGQYVGGTGGIGQTIPGQGGSGGAAQAMRERASDRSLATVGQGQIQQQESNLPGTPMMQPGQVQGQQQPQMQIADAWANTPNGARPPQIAGQPPVQPGQPIPGGYGAFQNVPQQQGQSAFGQPGQPGGQLAYNPNNQPIPGRTPTNPFGGPVNNTQQQNQGNNYVGGGGAYVGGGSYVGGQSTAPAPVGPFGGPQQQFTPPLPNQPGMPVNSQTGGVSPSPYPTTQGANGQPSTFPQPGMNPQGQSEAIKMLNGILGGPRQGGPPQVMQGAIGGGSGIAGFASNAEDDSIMVYNDRSNYGEWEFLFDPLKQKIPPNPLTGAIGNPAAALNTGQSGAGTGTKR